MKAKLLILCLLISTVQAETYQEWAMQYDSDHVDVCDIMPEYGKVLLGSSCYDWSNCPDCRMFCILGNERVQVWSNQECRELREKRGLQSAQVITTEDPARRTDGSLYRHHWCAAHCSLGLELPYDCADWSCS